MSLKTRIHHAITPLLRPVVEKGTRQDFDTEADWQKNPVKGSTYNPTELPAGAEDYLRLDHPRLRELRKRYAECPSQVTASELWDENYVRPEHLRFFRGDNPYVWQLRYSNAMGYALAFYYLLSIDHLGLLEKLEEDDAFGNFSFVIQNNRVSRDLLDSINEFYFLDRHLKTLDAHRLLDAGHRCRLRASRAPHTERTTECPRLLLHGCRAGIDVHLGVLPAAPWAGRSGARHSSRRDREHPKGTARAGRGQYPQLFGVQPPRDSSRRV